MSDQMCNCYDVCNCYPLMPPKHVFNHSLTFWLEETWFETFNRFLCRLFFGR